MHYTVPTKLAIKFLKRSGIRATYRKAKGVEKQLEDSGKEKINKTDPDAVFMKTGNGIKTSYNAHASTVTEHQVIVASDVTNQASDVEQLLPMVEQSRGEHVRRNIAMQH
jgi:hypothetical protein